MREDLAAAISDSDAVYAGDLDADFLAGALSLEGFDAGAVLLAGVLAGGVESADAAIEESAFLLLDFLGVVESAAGAAEAESAFLLFFDFFVVLAEV
jgi:hypothetical protein